MIKISVHGALLHVFLGSALLVANFQQAVAGVYIFAGEANGTGLVTHPVGVSTNTGGIFTVNVCIDSSSTNANDMVTPVINLLNTLNRLNAISPNLEKPSSELGSSEYDFESIALHEVGHCLGLAHPNLATESGLSGTDRNFTKSTDGADNIYNIDAGTDTVNGSADDQRGDDVNLHWFEVNVNNPFSIPSTVSSSTYTMDVANLPSGESFPANADRDVGALYSKTDTESIMQQGSFNDEIQRDIMADDYTMFAFASNGRDQLPETSDDYQVILKYAGQVASASSDSGCDVSLEFDDSMTSFAVCSVSGSLISGADFETHVIMTRANAYFNTGFFWYFNSTSNAPTVSLAVDSSSFAENAGTATVTATLSALSSQDTTITLAFSGDATKDTDYSASNTSIAIAAGSTTGTITLTGLDDNDVEGSESILIDIDNVTNATENGTQQVSTAITDDDSGSFSLSITPTSISENGGTATGTVTRNTSTTSSLIVNLVSDDISEATVPSTVTLAAGNSSADFILTGVDDVLVDGTQTVILTASLTGFTSATSSLSVTDDEVATLSLDFTSSELGENSGKLVGRVKRNTDTTASLTVSLSSSDTSEATVPAIVTIAAGETSISFNLVAVDDSDIDGDQAVSITASATGLVNGSQTISITDDDSPALSLAFDAAEMNEDNGLIQAIVSRNGNTTSELLISLASDDTSSATVPASVTLAIGSASASFEITGISDNLSDNIAEPLISVSATGYASASRNILVIDSDLPKLTISLSSNILNENSGTLTGILERDGDTTNSLTVNLLSSDTTEAIVSSSLSILATNTSASFTITGVDDELIDGTQFPIITFSATDYNTVTTQLRVTDNETLSVILELDQTSLSEASSTSDTLTARISTTSSQPVTLNLIFSGTATANSDYAGAASQLVIAAGNTQQSLSLTMIDDLLDENDETLIVSIDSVENAAEDGIQQTTTLITDDDNPPLVTLSTSASSFSESSQTNIITRLSAISGLDVTSQLDFSGTAVENTDYSLASQSLTVSAGSGSAELVVSAIQDSLDENTETIFVEISSVSNGLEDGIQTQTLSIDDDDPLPSVSLLLTNSPFAEAAGVATLTLSLSEVSGRDVSIILGYSGTASSTDYTASDTTLVIAQGNTQQQASLTGIDDADSEGDETVIVDITGIVNGTENGTEQVTATITDDEISDQDGDGIADNLDNCPTIANADQVDSNNDNEGDVCDSNSDTDGDGIVDSLDPEPTIATSSECSGSSAIFNGTILSSEHVLCETTSEITVESLECQDGATAFLIAPIVTISGMQARSGCAMRIYSR